MLTDDYQQSEIMTLHVFDSQDDSMLEAVHNMSTMHNEAVTFDYLQDCVSSLESKNSEINLSPVSVNSSNNELQLDSLDKDYKNTDLSAIEYNFVKIENMLLQNIDISETDTKDIMQDDSKLKSSSLISPIAYETESTYASNSKLSPLAMDVTNSIMIRSTLTNETKKCVILKRDSFIDVKDKSHSLSVKDKNQNHQNNESETKFRTAIQKDENLTKVDSADILNQQIKSCEQCSMTFRYKRHLDRHLEGHKKNNCSHCNAKFARRKHLEVHLFRAHGERVTKYPHSCDVCSRSFPKRVLLNRHRAKHNYENGKVCSECGEMLKSEDDYKEHKKNHCIRKQFNCKRCLQTFSNEQTYLSHIQNHNNYKCSECDVTFASKKKAHEHYKIVHSPKIGDSKASRNGIYFCDDCRHSFFKKDDYCRHLESMSHLNKTNRDMPTRDIFNCSICSKKLISQRALDQHVRRIHKREKRFMCNIYGCTFQCARRTDLDRHKQLHIEQRNIICEQCGKTFTSVSILNDHVLYVHNKERQFICEECGKAFKRNSLLKRHKLSHQQFRPFACMQCSTAFKRSHHLTRHMEACHRIKLERKKKVVKLMKTEDGHLVPVPEKPKKLKSKLLKIRSDSDTDIELNEKSQSCSSTNVMVECMNSNIDLQLLCNSDDRSESPNFPLEFTNLLPDIDSTPQVLSLVDIHSGQVVTVEVTSPETLAMNDLIDQFETNCHETLSLPSYPDLEFQSGILNTDQNFYDHASYSELSLGNVDTQSLLLDSNTKIDTLPAIESYLNQPFPSFLNL